MLNSYAIIALQGKQYLVEKGTKLIIDSWDKKENEIVNLTDVLLIKDNQKTFVGEPLVKNASVNLKVIKNQKADKIIVFKYKSKSRYRRTKGHRQHQTVLEVSDIKLG